MLNAGGEPGPQSSGGRPRGCANGSYGRKIKESALVLLRRWVDSPQGQ